MAYGPPPSPGQPQPGWQQPGQQWRPPAQNPAWQQPQQPPQQAWQQPQPGPQQPGGQGWQAAPPQDPGPADAEELNWALMAYIGQFVIGALAPAIVYFGKIRSPYVRRHAAQGMNMGIASAVVWLAGLLLAQLVAVFAWIPVLFTGALFFYLVYAGRAAVRGEFRRVPVPLAWPLLK